MGKLIKILLMLVLLGLMPMGSGCLLEEKTVQLVVKEKTSSEYVHSSQDKVFSKQVTIDFAAELDDVLGDEGVDKSDIVYAVVSSLYYSVTAIPPSQTHDWDISGGLMIGRDDIAVGPDTLITYTRQSVRDAFGVTVPARLHADGVSVINQALDQYIAGTHSPRLVFIIENGDVDPEPNSNDRIEFTWKTWLEIHVVVEKEFEVPDPL